MSHMIEDFFTRSPVPFRLYYSTGGETMVSIVSPKDGIIFKTRIQSKIFKNYVGDILRDFKFNL